MDTLEHFISYFIFKSMIIIVFIVEPRDPTHSSFIFNSICEISILWYWHLIWWPKNNLNFSKVPTTTGIATFRRCSQSLWIQWSIPTRFFRWSQIYHYLYYVWPLGLQTMYIQIHDDLVNNILKNLTRFIHQHACNIINWVEQFLIWWW